MTRSRTIVLAGLLGLAGCSTPERGETDPIARSDKPTTVDRGSAAIDAAVAAMYEPYLADPDHRDGKVDWERPLFSAGLTALIREWKKGFSDDEVAEMQDFAWLCGCQDWDAKKFAVALAPYGTPANGRVTVDLGVNLGFDAPRAIRLELVDEGGRWLIDDIVYEGMPESLRAGLVSAMAEHTRGPS